MLRFVAEAESVGGDEPFTGDFLVELGRLVEADWVTYCELDRVRRRTICNIGRTGDDYSGEEEIDPQVFWHVVVEEHPVCVQHQRGVFKALKVTDFLTGTQLRRSRIYNLWLRPLGVEHELNVAIPSPLWHTKTFLFDRADGRDFTERDRLVLDLLQPHLARLWQAARSRRLLAGALTELERHESGNGRGVVFLGSAGSLEYASPPARRMLRDFFEPRHGERLPAELEKWLVSGSRLFLRRRGRRELTVECCGDTLVLHERRAEVALTTREREVLSWVARGKTNPQIAELLWVSPGTVRKHLENVYGKLGVNTRTAAAARFLGMVDEASS
jgi:DNA-binding CsgD family transcriptional regulator